MTDDINPRARQPIERPVRGLDDDYALFLASRSVMPKYFALGVMVGLVLGTGAGVVFGLILRPLLF